MKHVLIAHDFAPDLRAQLDDEPLTVREVPDDDAGAGLDRYPGTEVLYTLYGASPWRQTWQVQWIQLQSAGVDHLKLAEIPAGVRITTASGVHATAIAEHAIGMLLVLTKGFRRFFDLQSKLEWRHDDYGASTTELLRGTTVGILGYGSIGREIGRLSKAFGMRVLASKRDPNQLSDQGFRLPGTGDPEGTIPEAYYADRNIAGLYGQSDVVVNALPLTRETEGVLDRRAFQAMKARAIFINVGRGRTVDEAALIDALRSGHLAAAGLDATATEPLPSSSPLWRQPNVVITPHVSGNFRRYEELCMGLFRENLGRYLRGEPLLNEVDRSRGY